MHNETPNCARCPYKASDRLCRDENGKSPAYCPTRNMPELLEQSLKEYNSKPEILDFARQAAIQEADGYVNRDLGYDLVRASKSRIEEIMEFSEKMNYKRLGVAFCIGLRKETKIVEKIFSSRGFEVVSAVCKVGRVPKEHLGVGKEQQIATDMIEAMCNPVLQAQILNNEQTDFNVLIGLCVGHDSLFLKYSNALCTILAVKDRLLAHNPLAAVYNIDSYYRCLR